MRYLVAIIVFITLVIGGVFVYQLMQEPEPVPTVQTKNPEVSNLQKNRETEDNTDAKNLLDKKIPKPAGNKQQFEKLKFEDFKAPTFDITRVEPDGSAVIAGQGHAKSIVSIFANDKAVASVKVGENESWLHVTEKPLNDGKPGAVLLRLSGTSEDGAIHKWSTQTITIFIPEKLEKIDEKPLIIAQEEGKPTKVVQKPQRKIYGKPRISIDTFDYVDSTSIMNITGTAPPQMMLKLYIDNRFQLGITADQNGKFSANKKITPLEDGKYRLRLDAISPQGKVIDRIEVTFSKEANRNIEIHIVRGDNLWNIARKIYGSGFQYTVIYEANKENIRDPDLIYPGQVFVAPRKLQ